MRHAVNGSIRVAWEEQGEGPPLLLVMGHMFGRHMWHWVLPSLAAEHRVLIFDNRGVGDTDAPRGAYTIEEMTGDALAVLDAAEVDHAHVFGMSLGGLIAQELALSQPSRVDALVLGCTAAFGPESRRTPKVAQRVKAAIPAGLALRVSKPLLYGKGIARDRVALDRKVFAQQRTPSWGLLGQSLAVDDYRSLDRIDAIKHRTLVLHGDRDRAVPLERGREIAERIPDSRLVVLPGAGHNFIADMPDRASTEVLEFLR